MALKEISISPRVQEILDHRHDHYDRNEIGRRDKIYFETFKTCQDDIKAMQFAKGFENFLMDKRILIQEYDILAGYPFRYTYESTMPIRMPSDFNPQFRPPSYVAPKQEAQACIDTLGLDPESEDAKKLQVFAKAIPVWLFKHWESGHIIPFYEKLLNKGFGGLIEEGKKALENANEEQAKYINAMIKCDEAAAQYILRYADLADEMIYRANKPVYRNDLERMSAACKHIAYGVPRTFYEAAQLLWLAHEILYCENYPASESFGRFDKYMYPFYEKDINAGVLTHDEAVDILDALWIKFGATLHGYQNITLGGWNPDGTGFMTNAITIMAMQASRKFKFDQPLICLRYNEDIDEDAWDESIALMTTGTGFPAFFGDEACTRNKAAMDIPEEDAREFGLIGCVEMAVPGKEYAKTEVLRVNWGKIMEIMLQGGQCTMTNDFFDLAEKKDLHSITSFEEFYQWYKDELLYFTNLATDCINLLDRALVHCSPTPYLSTLMEGCFQKGMDVTGGGAIYNNTGINACGMANAVDSLAAIKKLVFEEKKYTLTEFAEACNADFKGYDELHNDVVYNCPKYGNDIDEVDFLYKELIALYGEFVDELRNPRGGKFQLGLYSVEDHSKMGVWVGALPDGKLAGQAMANAASPVQGRDTVGPTAVINSLLKTDLSVAKNGMVLDLKFSPSFFKTKSHVDALKAMINTYFREGGVEIQFNVIDRATLLAAQDHPDDYKELVVRVSGFSAVFTSLMKETQDDIIARTEYQAI